MIKSGVKVSVSYALHTENLTLLLLAVSTIGQRPIFFSRFDVWTHVLIVAMNGAVPDSSGHVCPDGAGDTRHEPTVKYLIYRVVQHTW